MEVGENGAKRSARNRIIVLIVVALALPLLWRYTALREWINLATVFRWQASLRGHPAAPLFVIATYLLGSLVFFPITILTLATIFAFGPLWGNLYALAGWLLASAQGYLIGRLLGHDLRKLAQLFALITRVAVCLAPVATIVGVQVRVQHDDRNARQCCLRF